MIRLSLNDVAGQMDAHLVGADAQFEGCSTDTRSLSKGELFVALRGPNFDGHTYLQTAAEKGATAIMIDQHCETTLPALKVDDTREALGELANLWRSRFDIPVIGITGSNGKTTVKEMLSAILNEKGKVLATQGNLNNDIGVPQTLFGLDRAHDFAVIEMGANHVGEIAQLGAIATPTIGLVTLCAPAHLEGFGSIDNVALTKGEIYQSLDATGTAIVNADDHYASLWRDMASGSRILNFGMDNRAEISAKNVELRASDSLFDLVIEGEIASLILPLPGKHNVMNALAATASAHAVGVQLNDIVAALSKIQGVAGRLQFKTARNGISVIDDTYNANPRSLAVAIDVLIKTDGRHWLVLGDMGELGPDAEQFHADVGEQAREKGVERMYCVGPLSQHAAVAFGAGAVHFANQQELISSLISELDTDITILVKGSRSARMETVVNALTGKN